MHIEDALQTACVTWFDLQYPSIAYLLHHSPNGGKRDAREAARFKRMGVRAGFPDLILLYPASGYNYLAIELKTKTGRQSPLQKQYEQLINAYGGKYVVCRSVDDFQREVKSFLFGAGGRPVPEPPKATAEAAKEVKRELLEKGLFHRDTKAVENERAQLKRILTKRAAPPRKAKPKL